MTTTSGNATTITYVRVAKRPNPLAAAYWWYLERVCAWSHHLGACCLLNSRYHAGLFGRLWHRFVGAVMRAADDARYERVP